MQYDFSTVIDRTDTGSSKWNQMKGWKPDVASGTVPFSVADMEIKNPPEIFEGLCEYLKTEPILGYGMATEQYISIIIQWMENHYGWKAKSEWLITTPGVVNAFYMAVKTYTEPGDGVIVMTPVYYPFYGAIEKNSRVIVRNPLINNEGHYEIDFDDLEEKAKNFRNKLLIMSNPHNPVGRVWTKDELVRIGRICIDHNVYIVSDEIHCDLIMPGFSHVCFATISEEFALHSIICTAPSKTFNMAGMQTSNIFIQDAKKRQQYLDQMALTAQSNRVNLLGYKACELAYTRCEEWLRQLITLIDTNRCVLQAFIEENLPLIKVINMEGTYLQWMDFRGLGWEVKELECRMQQEAELFFDEGYVFGKEGEGFERMNLACPTHVVTAGLERLRTIVNKYNSTENGG